jgi:hypothetical protein
MEAIGIYHEECAFIYMRIKYSGHWRQVANTATILFGSYEKERRGFMIDNKIKCLKNMK